VIRQAGYARADFEMQDYSQLNIKIGTNVEEGGSGRQMLLPERGDVGCS